MNSASVTRFAVQPSSTTSAFMLQPLRDARNAYAIEPVLGTALWAALETIALLGANPASVPSASVRQHTISF
jgi:hypothetical protein